MTNKKIYNCFRCYSWFKFTNSDVESEEGRCLNRWLIKKVDCIRYVLECPVCKYRNELYKKVKDE